MLQSLLAVIGGFAAMAVLVMISTAIAATMLLPGGVASMATPTAPLSTRYLATNLGCSGVAALTGGMLTARLAPTAPAGHGVALAALMLVMSFVSMRQAKDRQPRWYQVTLMTLMPAVAIAGAWAMGVWSEMPR